MFRGAQEGTIAIIAALTLVMVCGAVGVAIDYGRALGVRSKLQAAVDSAALAAASDPYATEERVTSVANALFASNSRLGITPSLSVSRLDNEVTVRASLNVPTTFAGVLGIEEVPIEVMSKSGLNLGELEVYVALDMSASLGIAADPAARTRMEALTAPYTTGGCLFGCHQRDGWEPTGETAYSMAKREGIPLREDVLSSAFGELVDVLMSSSDPAVAANRRRMAVIGFSDDAQLLLNPTTNASALKAAPATFPAAMRLNTKFAPALARIKSMVGPQGSGFNGSPRKLLLLVTDGVGWERNGSTVYNGPIAQDVCDSIKNDGITLAVLEVKYQDATGEYFFDTQVAPFYADVSPALQACATPGYYFRAADSGADMLATAFQNIGTSLRMALSLRR